MRGIRDISITNVIANTSHGCFFLQGEPQENSCRESLSEALGGLGVLVIIAWVAFFYRESCRDPRRFGMFDAFLVLLISP